MEENHRKTKEQVESRAEAQQAEWTDAQFDQLMDSVSPWLTLMYREPPPLSPESRQTVTKILDKHYPKRHDLTEREMILLVLSALPEGGWDLAEIYSRLERHRILLHGSTAAPSLQRLLRELEMMEYVTVTVRRRRGHEVPVYCRAETGKRHVEKSKISKRVDRLSKLMRS